MKFQRMIFRCVELSSLKSDFHLNNSTPNFADRAHSTITLKETNANKKRKAMKYGQEARRTNDRCSKTRTILISMNNCSGTKACPRAPHSYC